MEEEEYSSITSDILSDSSPAPSLPPPAPLSRPIYKPEHVSIVITTVALFLVTMMVAFIIQPPGTVALNPPPGTVDQNPFVCITYMFSIYISFFIGVSVSGHLIISPASLNVTIMWIREKLILIGLGFFSLTFVLRTCMTFPLKLLRWVWVLVPLAIVAITIVLVIARKYNKY